MPPIWTVETSTTTIVRDENDNVVDTSEAQSTSQFEVPEATQPPVDPPTEPPEPPDPEPEPPNPDLGSPEFYGPTRGPMGTYVTVWGVGLTMTGWKVGGQPATPISITDDPEFPPEENQPQLQRALFQPDGPIEYNGIEMDFYPTDGTIYTADPGQSLRYTLDQMQSGDLMYLRNGNYSVLDPNPVYSNRQAILWLRGGDNDGITIAQYPNERAVILHQSEVGFDSLNDLDDVQMVGFHSMGAYNNATSNSNGRLVNFNRQGKRSNLRIIGVSGEGGGDKGSGAFLGVSNTQECYVQGCSSRNTGTQDGSTHVYYHGGRGESVGVYFEWNRAATHADRRGIQLYGHQGGMTADPSNPESIENVLIRRNRFIDWNNNGILLSHYDGDRNTPREERKWIKDALVVDNLVTGPNSSIELLGSDPTPEDSKYHLLRNRCQGKINNRYPTPIRADDNEAGEYVGEFTGNVGGPY